MTSQTRRPMSVPKRYDIKLSWAILSTFDISGLSLLREDFSPPTNGLETDWQKLSGDWCNLTEDYAKARKKIDQELEENLNDNH